MPDKTSASRRESGVDGVKQYEHKPELSEDDWADYREEIQERYRFYILNPAWIRGVEYSLWIQEDDVEFPVLSSNTGGFPTFNSRDTTIGQGIKPTREFASLVAYGAHEAMCFMPSIYFREDHFKRLYNNIYDEKTREYEVWAAQVIVDWMLTDDQLIPELEPLARWADRHTEFGIPILGDDSEVGSDE